MFNERGATLMVFNLVLMVPSDVIVFHLAKRIAVDDHIITGHHKERKIVTGNGRSKDRRE